MTENKAFSVIVPVYNEEEILEKNAGRLVEYCSALCGDYEILLVDNGSIDSSAKIGALLQNRYARVKSFSLPARGVGRAFKKGIKESSYDHLIFMDADLSANISFIERSNELLNKYDLVLGAKFKGLQYRSAFRKLGSFVFYISVLAMLGMNYVDYAPGAKAYRKSFLARYFDYIDDYTGFVLNLTYLAKMHGDAIVEIPITCDDRRKSRFNLWHEAVVKFSGLFRLKFKRLLGKL